jgi:hypothetical protein
LVWLSISACSWFLQGSAMPGFPHSGFWVTQPTQGLFQLCILPPPQAEGKYSLCVFGHHFVQRGCSQLPSCARRCVSLPNSVLGSPGWLADLLGWKQSSYRAEQAGGRQRFCVHLCLAGPGLPKCLQQLSFCSFLHCIIVDKIADTLRWGELCTGG